MKRITALLLALSLLLPCAALADIPVTLTVNDMTLRFSLPDGWSQSTAVDDAQVFSEPLVEEGFVFFARGEGEAAPCLVICAMPAKSDTVAGERVMKAVDLGSGFVRSDRYVNSHAEYTVISISKSSELRTLYAILVNGYEYTLEFSSPAGAQTTAWDPQTIIDSLRFRPVSAIPAHCTLNLSHRKSGQTSVTLQWATELDVAYRVEYRTGEEEWVTQSDAVPGNGRTLTYTVQGLEPGAGYAFRVTPVTSAFKATAEEITAATQVPPHGALNLTPVDSTDKSIALKWNTQPGATYRVEYRTDGGEWVVLQRALSVSGTSITQRFTGLTASCTYAFRVTAMVDGADVVTEEITAATQAPPHCALNLTPVDSTDKSISLKWNTQPGATYRVEYRLGSGEWTTQDESMSVSGTSITYRLTGLSSTCTYAFRVTAMVDGADVLTEEITAATQAPTKASASSATDTHTVTLPAIGITLDVPASWIYGTPEMGMDSPLVAASGMTEEDFDLVFVQQNLHFYAVVLPDGLACCVLPVEDLPEMAAENKDALLAELHTMTNIPYEPTARVFIPRATGSFAFLQYELEGASAGFLFGQGANGGFVLSLQALTGGVFPMNTMNALMNSIRVIE